MIGIERRSGSAGNSRRSRAHRTLAAACLAVSVGAFSQPPGEAGAVSRPFTEAGAGTLYFRTSPVAFEPATRLATDVGIEVTGIVARVSVEQRFRNDGGDWVEGVYVFPLPDDAAVDRLTMRIGDRRIEGEIRERERAKRIYEAAREAGRHASLVEQERPNLFTTSVANVAPGQTLVVEIAYLQTVAYDAGRFALRFPMTLTPRFVPGRPRGTAQGEGWSFDTTRVADASRITPPVLDPGGGATNAAAITASIDAGVPLGDVDSRSHDVVVSRERDRYALALATKTVPMDRDFVIEWRPALGREPRLAAFTEELAGDDFVLLMFLPPDAAELPRRAPRELIFVVDTSGSMAGNSIAQAKTALRAGLARLSSADRFNVIEFNSTTRSLHAAPVAVTTQTLGTASDFVNRLGANGGTVMEPAVRAALEQPRRDGHLRQIVFITDGSVGNEAELFATIKRRLGAARLFTIGIGSAPNTHFMRKASQFGRGTFLHIARSNEVAPRMRELFDKLEHAALTDISLEWPESAETYPRRVPDLYLGEPVVVAARLDDALGEPLTIEASGRAGGVEWTQRIDVEPGRSPGVATTWARRKIESLLDSRLEGAEQSEIRDAVVDVALRHGLVSPYTSFVAVDKTPQRSQAAALRREAVANMLPAGADIGAIFGPLPQTATDARLHRVIGTVLVALLLGLLGIARLAGR